ncbi:HutD family protein [Phenylobacterium sp.]|uniref:HutD/Ves family protein n=1 Tax=Phenylobacterium sp. TaxID=1871053 RepID=UPI00289FDC7E|nr:HutD family protein [Phenylobacterium sp.]
MRILRAADRKASPWKNGGGVTWEVAASPAGAPLDDFEWRVSLAEVASPGPFSRFPGIDRILTVIRGQGLSLAVEGLGATALGASSAPYAFPGDIAATAALSDGPIRDLNVMTRRGRWAAQVRRMSGPVAPKLTAETVILVALTPLDVGDAHLSPEDAILFEGAVPPPIGEGAFVLVELHRA